MIERPIIFNGEMVRAILEGRKTQTRRPIKGLPQECVEVLPCPGRTWKGYRKAEPFNLSCTDYFYCPFGRRPGDRMWVRETFADLRGGGFDRPFAYFADSCKNGEEDLESKRCRLDYGVRWRPSIHMPRLASRITLEIDSIRAERLQDITEEDAKAEGIDARPQRSRDWFVDAWNSIYGNWSDNPFVWVVEFHIAEVRP